MLEVCALEIIRRASAMLGLLLLQQRQCISKWHQIHGTTYRQWHELRLGSSHDEKMSNVFFLWLLVTLFARRVERVCDGLEGDASCLRVDLVTLTVARQHLVLVFAYDRHAKVIDSEDCSK